MVRICREKKRVIERTVITFSVSEKGNSFIFKFNKANFKVMTNVLIR